ncbi:MAG: SDR family oxidoreductase [Alphaproteobacteria bacterium]|nr:SDR family oxidoreductase [Alphaproteobacteria bacterium]
MAKGGKILLVTGASRGIGAAIARLAGRRGYDVCVNYVRAAAEAEKVVADVRAQGQRAVAVRADVARADEIELLFAETDRQLGPVTALVNNAGITGPYGRMDALKPGDIDAVLVTNVRGALLCTQAAARRMSTRSGGRGGAIVNVSSRASDLGGPTEWVTYAASKGALDTLTIGTAKELAPEGIRVNAVNPGLILTDIHAAAGGADRVQRLVGSVPMGRAGTPEEVAEPVLFLLSDEASYVTGALLPVGGGR